MTCAPASPFIDINVKYRNGNVATRYLTVNDAFIAPDVAPLRSSSAHGGVLAPGRRRRSATCSFGPGIPYLGCMIVAKGLTKRYRSTLAVDDLSFEVTPGVVTGFLGPNGSGKSTTMRMIMGLDNPTSGTALVNGMPFKELAWPLREVGALFDAKAYPPGAQCL